MIYKNNTARTVNNVAKCVGKIPHKHNKVKRKK